MNKYHQPIEAEIDLHQMTKEEARKEVLDFLEESENFGYKKIRIITGKGLHSENGMGVLNVYVKEMLSGLGYEYQNAKYNEGGEGALDVFL
ncbi:MAG: Smr/MutS family protein [Candidatus Paceibacterota bacterium]